MDPADAAVRRLDALTCVIRVGLVAVAAIVEGAVHRGITGAIAAVGENAIAPVRTDGSSHAAIAPDLSITV
jgi:hypothetical protein